MAKGYCCWGYHQSLFFKEDFSSSIYFVDFMTIGFTTRRVRPCCQAHSPQRRHLQPLQAAGAGRSNVHWGSPSFVGETWRHAGGLQGGMFYFQDTSFQCALFAILSEWWLEHWKPMDGGVIAESLHVICDPFHLRWRWRSGRRLAKSRSAASWKVEGTEDFWAAISSDH